MKIVHKRFRSFLLVFLVFVFSSQTNSTPVGTWEGAVVQTNAGSYPVVMSLKESSKGSVAGNIEYPSLDCGGALILVKIESGETVLREKLAYGKSRCTDGGYIKVNKNDNGDLVWRWLDSNGLYSVHGVLERSR